MGWKNGTPHDIMHHSAIVRLSIEHVTFPYLRESETKNRSAKIEKDGEDVISNEKKVLNSK